MSKRDLIVDAISQSTGLARNKLSDNTDIIKDLGLDSLDVMELMMELEEKCQVKIPDEDLPKLKTIGDLVAKIDSLTA